MLEQEIRSDIDERQKLMLQIKTLYLRYRLNEKDEKMFLIYSIPAVYAIWEGFIQNTFKAYIQELNKLELTVDTICKPILIHHLESKFPQFREYPKHTNSRKVSFFDNLNQFYIEKTIDISTIVNTESNVGFKVLKNLLEKFNLDPIPDYPEPRYSLSQELEKLLKIRNAVAHGQDSVVVNREDLEGSIELVNRLMDLVFEKIIDGFEKKSYLLIP